jgi:hypothetical protein
MNENWLTSTVFALCNDMRRKNDYASMPLLADALEDAGCTDAELLANCRSTKDTIGSQRTVCLLLGGEYAKAVQWLDEFCEHFRDYQWPDEFLADFDPDTEEEHRIYTEPQLTYSELVSTVVEGGNLFYGFDTPEIAYDTESLEKMVSIVTGVAAEVLNNTGWSFSCAC